MTIEQFWEMTWHDFTIYRTAHARNIIDEWTRTRRIAYMIYVMNSADKVKMSEQAFHKLPIDEAEERGRPLTIEEIQNTIKLYSGSKN